MRAAVVVLDLGYGDQGKGTITDFLVRDLGAHTVVRYNGGAQAGHNVVTPDGRHHTFAQFGAGSFVPGVETVLTADVAIQPWAMLVEAAHLASVGVDDAFERTCIAAGAPVITPFHRAANRLRERARGRAAHGSCGLGVGETVRDARALGAEDQVVAADLLDRAELQARLLRIQARKRQELGALVAALGDDPAARGDVGALEDRGLAEAYVEHLEPFRRRARVVGDPEVHDRLARDGVVVFEGAQGVLLDEDVGFHPHTTWSRCTGANADALLRAHGHAGPVHRIGVLRAYATRHGAGPFVTEDPWLTVRLPDPHNDPCGFQGAFRVGWLDAVSARHALRACGGVDGLAITCLDRLDGLGPLRIATAYAWPDGQVRRELDVPPAGDLAARERHTAALFDARPVTEVSSRTGDGDAHLAALGEALVPAALVSRGPTAEDKRWLRRPENGIC